MDHPLDSLVVKRIEGKEKVKKKRTSRKTVSICCKGGGHFVPMKVAIQNQEASSKGSLLDRITSLETRLFQLCLEIEAARTSSCSSDIQTPFAERYSRNDANRQIASSYPTFDYSKPAPCKSQSHLSLNKNESSQKKCHRVAQDLEHPSCMKNQLGRSKSTKDGKTSESGKKSSRTINWPHLNFLGC